MTSNTSSSVNGSSSTVNMNNDNANTAADDVVIIIPVYNDTERLKTCLDALACQVTDRFNYKVWVVDNNSTENIKAVTDNYKFVDYLHESKPGSYHARNRAVKELQNQQFIGYTDADCIPAKTWIQEAVNALRDDPSSAVGGRIDVFAESGSTGTLAENYEILFAFPQKMAIETESFSVTANLFITREMQNKVGKFNCELFSGGDLDFGQRLHKNGFGVRYIDAMLIRHPARATLKQITSRTRRCAGGSYQQRKAYPHLDNMFTWPGIIYSFRPPLKDFSRIFSATKLSLLTKLKLCFLSFYLRIYRGSLYVGYKLGILTRMERF